MATYNKDPDKTIRLPLYGSTVTRAGNSTKDQRFLNCILESDKNETLRQTITSLFKRPGLAQEYTTAAGEGRNLVYFNSATFAAVGNKVYKCPSTTPIITLTNSTGPVGMILGDSQELGQYLFVCDGVKAWIVETNDTVTEISDSMLDSILITDGGTGYTTATISFTGGGGSGATATATLDAGVIIAIDITDAGTGYTSAPTVVITGDGTAAAADSFLTGFPNPHVPDPAFMDGYIFLIKGTDIWNCYLDDPMKWSPSDYITAEMYPDPIIGLARQNNQLLALGEYSTEYFYDAGNATGSPLNKNDAITIQVGLASLSTVSDHEKTVIWVGQSRLGGRSVWMIDGFQAKQISASPIERVLDLEADMSLVTGFVVRTKGHYLYLINLPTANRTFIYDIEEKLWMEWSSFDGVNHNMFNYVAECDDNSGYSLLLHSSLGIVSRLDPEVYKDLSRPIRYQMNSPRFDGGSYNRKSLTTLAIVGDVNSTTPQLLSVRWSDDDQQTYSGQRMLNLNGNKPILTQCGTFRRRSFELIFDGNSDIRLEALELTFLEGSH